MEPHIYLWSGERELFISRHDFYVEQVKSRILCNFEHMEEEANRVAEEVYERMGQVPSYDGYWDMSDIAETARDHGIEFWMMLHDLKIQTFLGSLASLYHQWDKDFRGFMERQLSHTYDRSQVSELCWHPNQGMLFNVLEECGWLFRQFPWFSFIRACRLIVNVYKHGKGRSLDELAEEFPQYLTGAFGESVDLAPWRAVPKHEDLVVAEEEFDQIAGALRQFWLEFPEHMGSAET